MRDVKKLIPSVKQLEGAGFEVRRPIPGNGAPSLGPFILLDHFGPVLMGPGEAVGAPTHPHSGIETLGYFIQGGGQHKDSLGNISETGPGDVQWMRSGRGIIHDELPAEKLRREGGRFHGVQLWLNMPGDSKFDSPDYRHLRASEIPMATSKGGCVARVIAGRFFSRTGPLVAHSDPLLVHLTVPENGSLSLPRKFGTELAIYVLGGKVLLGRESLQVGEGELAILCGGASPLRLEAQTAGVEVLFLGGPPVTDKLVRYGPFVANSIVEMKQVMKDYQSGSFGTIPP